MNNNDNLETLLDFDLLKKIVVGIGEVSDITGIPTRKIRYWEQKGIISSVKDEKGTTRKYNYLNIKKILLVQELIEEGYTLDAAAKKVNERLDRINDTFTKLKESNNHE